MRAAFLLPGFLLLLVGCSQQDVNYAGASSKQLKTDKEQAQKLFAELCAACHGIQARGGVGSDLTVSRFKYGKNAAAIKKSILDGRPGGMPAFNSHLKIEQTTILANYILSLE